MTMSCEAERKATMSAMSPKAAGIFAGSLKLMTPIANANAS
jgi:hypothetical protein